MSWLGFLVFLVVVVVIAGHSRFLTQFMAPLCELRQHRNDAEKHRLALDIVLNAVQFLRKRIGPSHLVDGEPVAIKLFVTEVHRFSDYDNDNDNDNDNRSAGASRTTTDCRSQQLIIK
jgi:hypothetical protein